MTAIVVCEPQCGGFEHAVPNAALLATAARAFHGESLYFVAEEAHGEAVRTQLGEDAPDFVQLPLAIPPRRGRIADRMRGEWATHAAALRTAKSLTAKAIVFASVSLPGLWALHLQLRAMRRPPVVLAIVHGMLAGLEREDGLLLKRLLGIRSAVRLPLPKGVKLIALGESIHEAIAEAAPFAAHSFAPLDLPNLPAVTELPAEPAPHDPPCFGYLGVANRNKGFDRFVRIARAVRERGVEARFLLAGFVPGDAAIPGAGDAVEGIGNAPLSREEYAARIAKMNFVLWTGEPAHYRLTASASFLDALAFAKPGIYLANRYINHYAAQVGGIGTLCDSEDALIEAVCEAAAHPDPACYAAQCRAILSGRRLFEPEALAPRLRAIAEACGFPDSQ